MFFVNRQISVLFYSLYAQVFIAIALILGDGLYNFVKVSFMATTSLYSHQKKSSVLPSQSNEKGNNSMHYIKSPPGL